MKTVKLILICLLILVLAVGTYFFALDRESPDEKYTRLIARAEQYVAEEKYEEARLLIQSAIEAKPELADGYYRLAEVLARLQKFDRALENYRSAINYDPKHREARLHLGTLLLAGRQFEQAEDQAEKLLELNAKDIDARILKANIEVASPRKNFARAKEILKQVTEEDPKSVAAISSLAVLAIQENNPAEGEALLLKALQLDQKNSALQMVLADLYAKQGRLDESQAIVEQVLREFPNNSALRFNFGEFLLKRGLSDQATEQYKQILTQDPLRLDARDRLYDIYLARQNKDAAKALTAELKQLHSEHPATQYFQGRDLEIDGDNAAAFQLYRKALPGLPQFAPVFRRVGLFEISSGETALGVQHLNQAIGIDGADIGARLALAQQAFLRRDFAAASEHVGQVLKRFPMQLGANVLRADIALVEKRFDEARRVYQFLIDNFPNSMIGFFKLALLEERSQNFDRAMELYEKTLSFDSNVIIPAQRLATILVQKRGVERTIERMQEFLAKSTNSKPEYQLLLGTLVLANPADKDRVAKARELFTKVLEDRPTLIGAYFALASLDTRDGNLESAAANYEKLIEKNPKHVPSQMLLALMREQQGRAEDAAKAYRAILSYSPRFGPAANNLAWLLVDKLSGDLDEALRLAEIAKEQLPSEGSVADTLGWIHFKRGNPRIALPILQDAVEFERKAAVNRGVNPEILFHLAQVQQALNDKPGALATITEALASAGEKHPLHASLVNFKKALE